MFDNFYGLTGKPFQLTPDPEFYFRSGTHRKALSYLGYGLAQGEGFIVITGEVGAGKSTLVAHLMQSLDPRQIAVAQIVTSKLDEEEVIHVVASSFGIAVDGHDKATALTAIEGFLHDQAREGRRCLLVIDEAQNLSVPALEELRMLSNFQLGNHPLLQTLLLGQPEFRVTLQADPRLEQLRQRVIAAHHLEPMHRGEIEPYIEHRLKVVGWDGNPAFDQRVFSELFEASGGIPRKVNQIANRLLLLGAIDNRSRIDAAMLQGVLAEMEAERALPPVEQHVAPARTQPVAEHAAHPVALAVAPPAAAVGVDPEQLDTLLAERDFQIAELQQAVVELSQQRGGAQPEVSSAEIENLHEQIALIEARCQEQERAVRQTVAMLIDWIDKDMGSSKAA